MKILKQKKIFKMDSFDWNRMAAAGVISCCMLTGCWFLSKTLIPSSLITASVFAKENQEEIDLKTASISRGETIASQQCGVCHSFKPENGYKIGPSLFNIKDRQIASSPNFSYSASLKAHNNEKWTVENLNKWLYKPIEFAPTTLMAYGGISLKQDRADVIAYLNSLTSEKPQPSNQNH